MRNPGPNWRGALKLRPSDPAEATRPPDVDLRVAVVKPKSVDTIKVLGFESPLAYHVPGQSPPSRRLRQKQMQPSGVLTICTWAYSLRTGVRPEKLLERLNDAEVEYGLDPLVGCLNAVGSRSR